MGSAASRAFELGEAETTVGIAIPTSQYEQHAGCALWAAWRQKRQTITQLESEKRARNTTGAVGVFASASGATIFPAPQG